MLKLIENGIDLDSLYLYGKAEDQEFFAYRNGYVIDRIFNIEGDLAKSLHHALHGLFKFSGWAEKEHPHKINFHPDNHETYGLKGVYFQFSDGVCYIGKQVSGEF